MVVLCEKRKIQARNQHACMLPRQLWDLMYGSKQPVVIQKPLQQPVQLLSELINVHLSDTAQTERAHGHCTSAATPGSNMRRPEHLLHALECKASDISLPG
eukprot:349801-Chlamydomonas_euryale.AAC.3